MERKDWLALCAVHSDAWLMSLAFFYAARFDAEGRAELLSYVNQHPTVYEVRQRQRSSPPACLPACLLLGLAVSGSTAAQRAAHRAAGGAVARGARAAKAHAPRPTTHPLLQVVTGRVARNKMYKRKVPKQQTAAAHAAVQSQAAALAAFDEPNPFVQPGYQAADQVGGTPVWGVGAPARAAPGVKGGCGLGSACERATLTLRLPAHLPRSRCPRAGC